MGTNSMLVKQPVKLDARGPLDTKTIRFTSRFPWLFGGSHAQGTCLNNLMRLVHV